ncbi:hypothetical protein [Kitasatospora sp. NBC_00458]|uniref:hypothetical protein n=1 Tax=Kitasatospora sp. NBC_00458 TaxID=2903568 RepID=UPI002E171F07
MKLKRTTAAGAVALAVAGAGLAAAPQASATSIDCHRYSACLYYNSSSHGYGAYFEQTYDIPNYTPANQVPYKFGPGAFGSSGAGVNVKNHAAYVDNWHPYSSFTVYEFSAGGGSGRVDWIAAYGDADLTVTHDNNAAGKFTG